MDHQGEIQVEGRQGEETAFTVLLPIKDVGDDV